MNKQEKLNKIRNNVKDVINLSKNQINLSSLSNDAKKLIDIDK